MPWEVSRKAMVRAESIPLEDAEEARRSIAQALDEAGVEVNDALVPLMQRLIDRTASLEAELDAAFAREEALVRIVQGVPNSPRGKMHDAWNPGPGKTATGADAHELHCSVCKALAASEAAAAARKTRRANA